MADRIFQVEQHYIVEIDQYVKATESDEIEKVWIWDIYIASDGKENYRGRAMESSGEYEVPWVELQSMKPLEEMIRHCKMTTFKI